MGGEIRIDSRVGVGTTAHFDIPVTIIDASVLASMIETSTHQEVTGMVPGQPHYRILVVDDRQNARQLARGYTCNLWMSASGKESFWQSISIPLPAVRD